jgi:histidinol-phosphate aminotransferase
MNKISISRRRFAQLLTAGAVTSLVRPNFSFAADTPAEPSGTVVRLSSNENPYGPSPQALEAMTKSFHLACRYPDDHENGLFDAIAQLNGVNRDQILLGDGSGEILKLCAEAFTGPKRGTLVAADPTFEAILNHAATNGAKVSKIPLTNSYAHDLTKMAAAAKDGLVYVCNPNNPTASVTPKDSLASFIAKTSPKTMILVDEAYFHFADAPEYESVIPLVKDHPNLLVARTFSKVYGMAGLRCGYCIGQPKAIEQLRANQPWDSVNIMAIVAALASLNDSAQVENGRRLNNEAKVFVTGELNTMGYQSIPSQANFFMVDVKRPVVPLIQAMKQQKVEVGRLFPAMPNHMRVTVGKKSEMESFLTAFRQVTV